jgi:Tol biopolymer transport system component
MPAWRHSITIALSGLLLAAGLVLPARAQDYFGQNKVRYRTFDIQVLKTEHFDIYYDRETAAIMPEAARMAERWYARISRALDHELTRRQPLILYPGHPAFEQTNAIYGDLGEGTGGVTEALKRRIVVPFAGPLGETDHVIGHELVHAFQYDVVGQGRSQTMGLTTAAKMPLWFMEGMAEYLTLGADDAHTAMWMRDAAQIDRLPDYGHLEDSRFFPYRFGQSLWAYVAGRYGEDAVGRLLKAASRSADVKQAFRLTLGVPADSVVMGWHGALRDWQGALGGRTDRVTHAAAPLVLARRGVGRMNLAPSLSPDGRRLLFFSERGQLSIELYVADAATGEVLHALTRSAVDPEIQNLGFINSAGEWSPDGDRFVIATASRGRPVLSIHDAVSGRLQRRFRFPELDEIFHPTWSPDGKRIAFCALAGGVTDLWVLDLGTGRSRRLMDDAWADLQPAWSPDGGRIAFVTDRFDADSVDEPRQRYRLALVDPESGAIRRVDTFATGKSINPQWAPDGRSLYFIADPEGIPDLQRVDLESGHIETLSRLLTGVSGITSLSPALTVARRTGEVVFSAYDAGSFELFRYDPARRPGAPGRDSLMAAAAKRDSAILAAAEPARRAPRRHGPGRGRGAAGHPSPSPTAAAVDSMRTPPAAGAPTSPDAVPTGVTGAAPADAHPAPAPTPADSARWSASLLPPLSRAPANWSDSARVAVTAVDTMRFDRSPYRPRLTLDYVSQPSLGVAAGSSGVAVGGGAGLYWSDMLGDHELMTLLQMSGIEGNYLNNTSAAVVYQNLRSRWDWGVQASQLPYITQYYSTAEDADTYAEQLVTYWQIERALIGTTAYPFSRFTRLEFNGGFRNISFAGRTHTWTYDTGTGAQLSDKTSNHVDGLPAALNLVGGGLALVHDSGVFGGTSPIMGQRFRFELDELAGSIRYNELLLDYRRYLRLNRALILAGRALHYGRYGPGANDDRLYPLFLGDPWFIRGYDYTSVGNQVQNGDANATDLYYRRLLGTRLAVANLELRVPLLGSLGLIPSPAVPPIEAALFCDAGATYQPASFSYTGDAAGWRRTLTSYGVSLRANLLGFAIGEAALVHPNDRPGQGWYWVLALQPGF